MIRNSIVLIALTASAMMADSPFPHASQGLSFQAQQSTHGDADYEIGLRALDARQWDQAVASFDASVSHKGPAADGATKLAAG